MEKSSNPTHNQPKPTLREEISKILVKWSMPTRQAAISEIIEIFRTLIAQREKAKDQAYYERNQLVCALSKIWESWLELHPLDDETWEKDWRHIVFIKMPYLRYNPMMAHISKDACWRPDHYQLSWHIHDSEVKYFDHLELRSGNSWDGHSTEEKYERLKELKSKYDKAK